MGQESLDLLAGDWRIYQLRRGHRFSTDDVMTALHAADACPHAEELLDIGSGIGSVGLVTLYRLSPNARLTGIEAQAVSVGLARRTAAHNGLDDRVTYIHGDLRDVGVLAEGRRFPLITGSPPYIPPGKGILSPIPQRAGARIELRGSIVDYCAAARRWLSENGRFCFVMTAGDPRTEAAPAAHGLVVLERRNVVFRHGRAPHVATLLCGRVEDGPYPPCQHSTLLVRGADGQWTDAYLQLRQRMGLPIV